MVVEIAAAAAAAAAGSVDSKGAQTEFVENVGSEGGPYIDSEGGPYFDAEETLADLVRID